MEEKVYKEALGYPIILEGLLTSAINIVKELRDNIQQDISKINKESFFCKKRNSLKQIIFGFKIFFW